MDSPLLYDFQDQSDVNTLKPQNSVRRSSATGQQLAINNNSSATFADLITARGLAPTRLSPPGAAFGNVPGSSAQQQPQLLQQSHGEQAAFAELADFNAHEISVDLAVILRSLYRSLNFMI